MTLSFGLHEIRAHKVILSQASDYFRAALEDRLRNAQLSRLRLEDEDSRAIKGMIGWMYGLHFDGKFNYVSVQPTVTCTLAGLNYLTYTVDLYVTGSKYMLLGLQSSIESEFRGELTTLANTSGFSAYVERIARQVYLEHADEARPLRPHVLGVVADSFDQLEGRGEIEIFKKLMTGVPELAWDLLVKFGGENKERRMLASQEA